MANGTSSSLFLADTIPHNEPWIIDSGASEHMTGTQSVFRSFQPLSGSCTITLADGSVAMVSGLGSVWLSPHLILLNDLFVRNLSYNLLSISKLTLDSNCVANFSPHLCVFQDWNSGKMIGRAKEFSGLYYFLHSNFAASWCNMVHDSSSLPCIQQILLLHQRLGHPSFSYLCCLFPLLFRPFDQFTCEVCQLAKDTRVPFPRRMYRESKTIFSCA